MPSSAPPHPPSSALSLHDSLPIFDGIAYACRALGIPVVSGNVSLYNETPGGPILPTPVVGTVGLLEDRDAALRMSWGEGDELWLIGDPADDPSALAGSELAWRRGLRGGTPSLDLEGAARTVKLLPRLARDRVVTSAHDLSVGGLGVALAKMAIASGVGAQVTLDSNWPGAALFGERAGRVVVGVRESAVPRLRDALLAAGCVGVHIGIAGGLALIVTSGGDPLVLEISALERAWRTAF